MDDTDNGASSSESVEAITVMSPNDRASAIGTGTPPSNSRWSPRSGSISAFAFRSRQEALPSPEAYQSSSYDSAPSSAEVYLDANVNASVGLEPQTLLILVGLPGSGKSTFTHALTALPVDARHRPWIRASQDDSFSGKRGEVEYTVRRALQRGCNVVVDRVNFDAAQRAHFIDLARTFNIRTWALVLEVPESELCARLSVRTGHPTLPDPATALGVLGRMRRLLVYPVREEGFERMLVQRDWAPTAEGVRGVMERMERMGSGEQYGRGRGRGRGRGWGRGGGGGGRGARGGAGGDRGRRRSGDGRLPGSSYTGGPPGVGNGNGSGYRGGYGRPAWGIEQRGPAPEPRQSQPQPQPQRNLHPA